VTLGADDDDRLDFVAAAPCRPSRGRRRRLLPPTILLQGRACSLSRPRTCAPPPAHSTSAGRRDRLPRALPSRRRMDAPPRPGPSDALAAGEASPQPSSDEQGHPVKLRDREADAAAACLALQLLHQHRAPRRAQRSEEGSPRQQLRRLAVRSTPSPGAQPPQRRPRPSSARRRSVEALAMSWPATGRSLGWRRCVRLSKLARHGARQPRAGPIAERSPHRLCSSAACDSFGATALDQASSDWSTTKTSTYAPHAEVRHRAPDLG
jgi:hypothetical protein